MTQDSGLRTQDSGLRTNPTLLKISVPYIKHIADKTRLYFDITDPVKGLYPLYFEVHSHYEQYLTQELSDSGLVMVLLYAMENGYNIKCDGEISERLYNQLTRYFIPAISKNIPRYKNICIDCKISDIEFNPHSVGTALSCGVDSFYTVLKNIEHKEGSKLRLTHLCLFNDGSAGNEGEKSRELYSGRAKNDEAAANELGLEFFTCDSNANEFLQQSHIMTHNLRTLAFPLALQKLFKIYYYSSGYQFSEFKFTEYATAYYDIFTMPILSNQNIRFELVGGETTRLGKIEFITQYHITQKFLNVCVGGTVENCSTCSKCIRTMLELYLLNKLDDYAAVFDINLFKRKKKMFMRQAILQRNQVDMAEIVRGLTRRHEINAFDYFVSYFYLYFAQKIKRIAGKILPRKVKDFLKKKFFNRK